MKFIFENNYFILLLRVKTFCPVLDCGLDALPQPFVAGCSNISLTGYYPFYFSFACSISRNGGIYHVCAVNGSHMQFNSSPTATAFLVNDNECLF